MYKGSQSESNIVLKVDKEGLVINGKGTFTGDISGASGTFTGNLSGSTITGSTITGGTIVIGESKENPGFYVNEDGDVWLKGGVSWGAGSSPV
jgi:hypothetical protein